MPDFNDCYPTITYSLKMLEELDHLGRQLQVVFLKIRALTICRAKLDLLDYSRRRVKYWLTATDLKILDPAKVAPLHQLQQLPARNG